MVILDYYNPDDLDVRLAELMVATSDGADDGVNPRVQQVLHLLREKLDMDVVYVAQFVEGERVFRFVDRKKDAPVLEPGMSDPLEESWCQRVVDGRLPEFIRDGAPLIASGEAPKTDIPIGTHISTPIVSPRTGEVFGTLCTFATHVNGNVGTNELRRLKYSAQMLAGELDKVTAWPELPKD